MPFSVKNVFLRRSFPTFVDLVLNMLKNTIPFGVYIYDFDQNLIRVKLEKRGHIWGKTLKWQIFWDKVAS